MSYRGVGGWYGTRRGDYGYRGKRGDTYDFSDVIGGSSSTVDAGVADTGGGIWSDVTGFLGDMGLTGPAIGQGILTGVKGLLGGGGGGASMPGGASTSGGGGGGKATRAAVKRAMRAGGFGGGGRHMNPTNVKALRRALRRLHRFDHLARGVLHVTSPKKHVSGFRFKRKHRRTC